jgi:hypothetical protein
MFQPFHDYFYSKMFKVNSLSRIQLELLAKPEKSLNNLILVWLASKSKSNKLNRSTKLIFQISIETTAQIRND